MKEKIFVLLMTTIFACRGTSSQSEMESCDVNEARVLISWDSSTYVLRTCKATLAENVLQILLEENQDSVSDVAIEISRKKKSLLVSVYQPWGTTDSSYVKPRFKILSEKIAFNKRIYNVGDEVRGKLDLLILAHKEYFSFIFNYFNQILFQVSN